MSLNCPASHRLELRDLNFRNEEGLAWFTEISELIDKRLIILLTAEIQGGCPRGVPDRSLFGEESFLSIPARHTELKAHDHISSK